MGVSSSFDVPPSQEAFCHDFLGGAPQRTPLSDLVPLLRDLLPSHFTSAFPNVPGPRRRPMPAGRRFPHFIRLNPPPMSYLIYESLSHVTVEDQMRYNPLERTL